MADIQSSRYPLAFPIAGRTKRYEAPAAEPQTVSIRTFARALEGMQKEAIVACAGSGPDWRMVSDEGPYLNGTDLAPFPLAFFTTGLANAYAAEILRHAQDEGVAIADLEIVQDSYYGMEGSAVRGDMLGSALPVELDVRVDAEAPRDAVRDLVLEALARCPADALLRGIHHSEFCVFHNGRSIPTGDVRPWPDPPPAAASDELFDAAEPDPSVDAAPDTITKLGASKVLFDVEGGAGSSLKSEQKRTLHVRGIARLRADGLAETEVQLFKPLGSNFRFLGEVRHGPAGGQRAPSPLAYLSAGIAFCYLTQIGRYAAILKLDLERYATTQDTVFGLAGRGGADEPSAAPVRARVDVTGQLDEPTVQRIVDMGERTCFLHAAARTSVERRLRGRIAAEAAPTGAFGRR